MHSWSKRSQDGQNLSILPQPQCLCVHTSIIFLVDLSCFPSIGSLRAQHTNLSHPQRFTQTWWRVRFSNDLWPRDVLWPFAWLCCDICHTNKISRWQENLPRGRFQQKIWFDTLCHNQNVMFSGATGSDKGVWGFQWSSFAQTTNRPWPCKGWGGFPQKDVRTLSAMFCLRLSWFPV